MKHSTQTPPQLAPIGVADAVNCQASVALSVHATTSCNPDAAVPSLHAGLAFATGSALHASGALTPTAVARGLAA